ncbi:hypothetical protein HYQ46_011505 [Verticillium longisporum]|nr:hypothetical protein HYQ46_011505 [Verticillium longisporum]
MELEKTPEEILTLVAVLVVPESIKALLNVPRVRNILTILSDSRRPNDCFQSRPNRRAMTNDSILCVRMSRFDWLEVPIKATRVARRKSLPSTSSLQASWTRWPAREVSAFSSLDLASATARLVAASTRSAQKPDSCFLRSCSSVAAADGTTRSNKMLARSQTSFSWALAGLLRSL